MVSILFGGTEINLFSYFFLSVSLVFVIIMWCHHSDPEDSTIHGDALMGFLVPYQLYIGKYGNSFGLINISLRAFELATAL